MGHPIFRRFTPFKGWVADGFAADFVGAKTNSAFERLEEWHKGRYVQAHEPPFDEEYFEWIDVLESVALAGEAYSMVELGAGYGRWAMRAAGAARQFSERPFHLVAVEAEPQHFEWLRQNFLDNDIDPARHRLIQAAVTDHGSGVMFYVGSSSGEGYSPSEWYGQAITKEYERPSLEGEEHHVGRSVVLHESGMKSIRVPSVTLEDAISDLSLVDLIDMDIQGEEFKVVRSSVDVLNEKVRRLHIGTHNADVETGIREVLGVEGWQCRADYPSQKETDTPYGRIWFGDGVQSWVNPKLAYQAAEEPVSQA
jgi:FkbM family methyltransferase